MLTLGQARYLVRKVIGEFGFDFVYSSGLNATGNSCQYVPYSVARATWPSDVWDLVIPVLPSVEDPREHTGCLVGRILDAAGETRHHGAAFCGKSIQQVFEALPDIATHDAVKYLEYMQAPQDRGRSWGWSWAQAEIFLVINNRR